MTILSTVLCVVTSVLWIQSYRVCDQFTHTTYLHTFLGPEDDGGLRVQTNMFRTMDLESGRGTIAFNWWDYDDTAPLRLGAVGFEWLRSPPKY